MSQSRGQTPGAKAVLEEPGTQVRQSRGAVPPPLPAPSLHIWTGVLASGLTSFRASMVIMSLWVLQ